MPKGIFPPDYQSPPVLTADARLGHLRLPTPPERLIFCPQSALLRHVVRRWRGRTVAGFFGETYLLARTKNQVAVAGQFGVGAPVIGVLLEEFAAWGVGQFALLGLAGGLQPGLESGELVLVESAVRDEGTSRHYLPVAPTISASVSLTAQLEAAVAQAGLSLQKGQSWTTDAPYRETAAAVTHYRELGVLTVEMETAALFAVARYCRVEAAALLAASDSLADGRWRPAPEPNQPVRQLIQAFDALVQPETGR